jgi:hypothetical protein
MSGSFSGADVELLRQLSRSLSQGAEQLHAIAGRLEPRITSLSWRGMDADRFRATWSENLVPSLMNAVGALRDASGLANNNANQQAEASGAGGLFHSASSSLEHEYTRVPESTVWPGQRYTTVPGSIVWPGQLPADLAWVATRQALDQNLPGFGFSYGDVGALIPGASAVLDVRALADKLQQGKMPIHELVDTVAGGLRSVKAPIALQPVLYGAGVGIGVWNTAIQEAEKTDFSGAAATTTFAYIADHPGDALNAAASAVVDALPRIVKNFTFW